MALRIKCLSSFMMECLVYPLRLSIRLPSEVVLVMGSTDPLATVDNRVASVGTAGTAVAGGGVGTVMGNKVTVPLGLM